MGLRGPKPSRPDGYHVTTKGYLRRSDSNGKAHFQHIDVWESVCGPIPNGMQVHHKNGDKQDNRIENLELVDAVTHKRIHSGCKLIDGEWWKLCGVCGEWKVIGPNDWYLSRRGYVTNGRCKVCHIRTVVEAKRRRQKARLVEVRLAA